jgi:hypothetical protein
VTELVILNNEAAAICGPCGGVCCKSVAGIYHPSQFGETRMEIKRNLRRALATGRYAVDWWDGDPRPGKDEFGRAMYVRPAHINVTRLYDASWGGTCVNLTDAGCSKPFDDRPHQCRDLVPNANHNCRAPHGKDWYGIEWLSYQDVIDEAAKAVQLKAATPALQAGAANRLDEEEQPATAVSH